MARKQEWNPSARDTRICFHNTHEKVIHQVWNVWHTFFCHKRTVITKTVEKGRTLHLIEQLSKDRTYFSTKHFFGLALIRNIRHKCIMEILSHLCSTCSKKVFCILSTFYFQLVKKTLDFFVNRGDENGCWQF